MCFQGCSWGRSTTITRRAPRCLLRCPPCRAHRCQQPPTRRQAAKTTAPRPTKAPSSSGPPPPPSLAGADWAPPQHTALLHGPRGHGQRARNWVSAAGPPAGLQGCAHSPRHPGVDGGKIKGRAVSSTAQSGVAEFDPWQLL